MTETMSPIAGAEDLTEILSALDTLEALPVAEHVTVLESIHHALQAVLEEPENE
ncbi:hypothetical protein SAMN05216410_3199 [Sanguibacter gelidistatuariae]|uniref:Uncharacterized protein n=1 Tax=Sanguibacter gelidistatuariae TaxID=1814289 RepID=A0A1G6TUD9_9MICO|nr:hypothetical protein [Sanguibacter gelidistatuariae]SDD32772.1 hypothetical protein SAMN05216410_3199 [Sanguibacter gelidistatuariae]